MTAGARPAALLAIVVTVHAAMPAMVYADKRAVQVLSIDGTASAATRAKLTASVQKLARVIDGEVKRGATTFADASAAAGCNPTEPACSESVRSLLGVDELVYGTANVQGNQVTVVVRRKTAKGPPTEVTATFAATDAPERIGIAIEPKLLPLFSGSPPLPATCADGKPANDDGSCIRTPACAGGATPQPDGSCPAACAGGAPPGPDGTCPAEPVTCAGGATPGADGSCPVVEQPKREPRSSDFKLGLGATIGGGVMFLVGLALWSDKAGIQKDIDAHPTQTVDDFRTIEALEDRAGSRALYGNVLVFGGLVLGGVGVYMLRRDHKKRAVVAPMVKEGAVGLTFTLIGGLR